MQEIKLDKEITLLDCPGVIFDDDKNIENFSEQIILRNAGRITQLKDPIPAVNALLKRVQKEKLMKQYLIDDFNDVEEFIKLVAERQHKKLKGGKPDIDSAARSILRDWVTGKIKYFTLPPKQYTSTLENNNNVDNDFKLIKNNLQSSSNSSNSSLLDQQQEDQELMEKYDDYIQFLPTLKESLDMGFIPIKSSSFATMKFEENKNVEVESDDENDENNKDEMMEDDKNIEQEDEDDQMIQ
jgi:hypothetical protein